jgi:hypothetical protein
MSAQIRSGISSGGETRDTGFGAFVARARRRRLFDRDGGFNVKRIRQPAAGS